MTHDQKVRAVIEAVYDKARAEGAGDQPQFYAVGYLASEAVHGNNVIFVDGKAKFLNDRRDS